MGGIQLTKTTSAVVVLVLSQYRADKLSSKRVYFSPLAMKRSMGDWAMHLRCEYLYCLYESYLESLGNPKS